MSVALNNDFYKIALKYDFCNIYVWISTNAIIYLLYNIIFNIFFQIQVLLIDLFFKVVTLRYKTHILLNTEIRFNPSTFLVFFLNICKRNKQKLTE